MWHSIKRKIRGKFEEINNSEEIGDIIRMYSYIIFCVIIILGVLSMLDLLI